MSVVDFNDLIYQLEFDRDAHASDAHACATINDHDGLLYHSGICVGFEQALAYLCSLLSELDSESGR